MRPSPGHISPFRDLSSGILPQNFVGTLGANGQMKEVNRTGNQFYQFHIVNGLIEGSVEMQDGSVKIAVTSTPRMRMKPITSDNTRSLSHREQLLFSAISY